MYHIVQSYENSREEDRLTTNNARRLEYLTTIRAFDELFPPCQKILDCAAGTGIYSFRLAEQGHDVTATDITPRHIDMINAKIASGACRIKTYVLDATDMSVFDDDSFDIVLSMGPFYHLITEEGREKCIRECLRVLRPGGLLAVSYIPRYSVFQYVATRDDRFLNAELARQIVETGVLRHDDPNCFWTDTYYSSKTEMESVYHEHSLQIVDHFAQDGLAPLLSEKVDSWDNEKFKIWCEYHYATCREATTIGSSNHAIIIGRKS